MMFRAPVRGGAFLSSFRQDDEAAASGQQLDVSRMSRERASPSAAKPGSARSLRSTPSRSCVGSLPLRACRGT